MAEYIEREAVIKKSFYAGLYDQNEVLYGSAEIVLTDEIRAIPAADVAPVVRCGECKHNKGKKIWADGDETFDCANGHGYPPLDWFCADGERAIDDAR